MAVRKIGILDVEVKRSQGYYMAEIPELGIADYAETKEKLMKNLKGAISLALEDMIESENKHQRKFASKVVSDTIMNAEIPYRDIKPLTNIVGNILADTI
jgi:predicted RNase H-like HicB family nuclease